MNENNVIELTPSMIVEHQSRRSVPPHQPANEDIITWEVEQTCTRIFGVLAIVIALCSIALFMNACTISVSIRPDLTALAADGGGEPLGYGMTQDTEDDDGL